MEVWGPPRQESNHGARHLQPYICSVARNAISFLQSGGLDLVDLIVVPHACDSLQGLGTILIDLVPPRQPVIPIYLPRGRRPADVDFLAAEFRSVYRRLQRISTCTPTDAELQEGIGREEAADGLLEQVSRHRAMPDLSRYQLMRAREYLPAERFTALAREALTGSSEEPGGDPVPLLLSGILPEPMALLNAISAMGGRVVADDLACCGRRLYPPGNSDEPFRRMAERIITAPPDPSRGSSIQDRLDHLLKTAAWSGARGVIFYEVKFCEMELFDLPDLRCGLEEAGISSLTIEMDLDDSLPQRVITRLEAFLEMLR